MKSAVLKRSAPRRLAIAALLLSPALAACGFSAQTDQVYQAATGPNYRSGDVWILDAVIVSSTAGSGTFAGTLENETGDAAALTSVTGTGVTAELAAGEPIKIAAHGLDNLGEAGETVPPAKLVVRGSAVKPGQFVTLTFTFASGSTATMKVFVAPVSAEYGDVPLPAPVTDTHAADPTASPSAE